MVSIDDIEKLIDGALEADKKEEQIVRSVPTIDRQQPYNPSLPITYIDDRTSPARPANSNGGRTTRRQPFSIHRSSHRLTSGLINSIKIGDTNVGSTGCQLHGEASIQYNIPFYDPSGDKRYLKLILSPNQNLAIHHICQEQENDANRRILEIEIVVPFNASQRRIYTFDRAIRFIDSDTMETLLMFELLQNEENDGRFGHVRDAEIESEGNG